MLTRYQKYRRKKSSQLRKWRLENLEWTRAQARAWKVTNRKHVKEYDKKYRVENRKRLRKYNRDRYRKNPELRLTILVRNRVRSVLQGIYKSNHTFILLGCSLIELKRYLEGQFKPGMTWENYGPVWHVDHIRPCATFNLRKSEQQKQCFHFTNLQPLFAFENLTKGAKYVTNIQ